jgi:hypothetical protein
MRLVNIVRYVLAFYINRSLDFWMQKQIGEEKEQMI